MSTTTIPTPSAVFGNRTAPTVPTFTPPARPQVAAPVDLSEVTKVQPGLVEEVIEGLHDGVVKAKHLEPGMEVQPWVKDRRTEQWAPRGSRRIVKSTRRVQNGAFVEITWATPHSPERRPASYTFHCAELVDTVKYDVVRKPGFVAYQEA